MQVWSEMPDDKRQSALQQRTFAIIHLQRAHRYILFQMLIEHKGEWVKEDDSNKNTADMGSVPGVDVTTVGYTQQSMDPSVKSEWDYKTQD